MPNQVTFHNGGAFSTSFSVQWNGGQTGRTGVIASGDTITVDLTAIRIPANESCWARAYIIGGPNHDSGDNFNYSASDGSTAIYTITGGTLTPSFSLSISSGGMKASALSANGSKQLTADDQRGRYVKFFDSGAFSCNFSVQWNGGQTLRTETVNAGQSTDTLDLTQYLNLPTGTSCWARVYIDGGVNHDSGRNFTYDPNSQATISYTVSGGSLTPSFD